MRKFLVLATFFSASLVLVAESNGQPPGPFPPGSPWNMYTTNRYGFVVTRPSNSWSAGSSSSRNRSARPAPARSAQPGRATGPEFFAPNLQIHYKLVRVGGTTGARLTRSPSSSSPALHVLVNGSLVYLEPNDVILHLDSLPIRQAADVLQHHSETTVMFLDHRSGRTYNGVMTLPAYNGVIDTQPQ